MDFVADMINMLLVAYLFGLLNQKVSLKKGVLTILIMIFWGLFPEEIIIVDPVIMCETMLMLLFMKGKFFQRVAWYVEMQMVIICIDLLLIDITLLIHNVKALGDIENLVIMVRFMIMLLLSGLLWKKKEYLINIVKNITFKESLYITVSLGINVIIMIISQMYLLGMDLSKAMPVFAVCTLLFGFLQLVLCLVLQKLSYSKRELKRLNEINQDCIEQQKLYYSQIDQKNQDLRRFRHDYNDQISVLNNLAQNGELEEIKAFLTELSGKKESVYYINTENRIVNAVINHIYEQAIKEEIKFEYSGKLPKEILSISDAELCSVLSNALRNALEAAKEADEKYIWVEAGINYPRCYIRIDNTFKNIVLVDGKLVSQKKDKKNHGLGMENIQRTMKTYGGVCKWQYTDNRFSMFISLPIDRL